jgi:hypothetical protein
LPLAQALAGKSDVLDGVRCLDAQGGVICRHDLGQCRPHLGKCQDERLEPAPLRLHFQAVLFQFVPFAL